MTGNISLAQASEADLENARLLYRASSLQDYFQLHGIDGDTDLLQRTSDSYTEYLTLTKNRCAAGVASDLDVAQAESQLYSTQASLIDLGQQQAAARTRHRDTDRQATVGPKRSFRSVNHAASTRSHRAADPICWSDAAGHRRGRTPCSGSERADWNRHCGLLSGVDAERQRRIERLQPRKVLHVAQPILVGRPGTFRDAF